MKVAGLLLIAACYQAPAYRDCELQCAVSLGACPEGFECIKGLCRASEAVACPSDTGPAPACSIPLTWAPNTSFNRTASSDRGSVTTDMSGQLTAVDIMRNGNEHDILLGPDGFDLQTVVVADVSPMRHRTPRLSPEGDEMFVQHYTQGSGSGAIVRWVRDGQTFVPLDEMVVFTDVALTLEDSDLPGTPTAISDVYPRRMMIPKGDGKELWELEQSRADPTRWDFVAATTAAELDFIKVRDPQLSWDGLRLVFTGSKTGSPPFLVYGMTRSSLWEPFRMPVLILTGTQLDTELAFPFLSADCKKLYGRNVGSGQVGERSVPR